MGYIKQSKCCSTQKDDSIEISTNIFINYDQIYIITIMMVIKKNYIYMVKLWFPWIVGKPSGLAIQQW